VAYLRLKKVKGQNYLYLVRSVWNSKKNTSKQEVIKYLGKASEAKVHDIPPDYRNDSKIAAFLASINPEKKKEKQRTINRYQKEMYKCCLKGDLDRAVKSFDEYHKLFSTGDFFDNVLKPVMYEIGKHWETGKISIAEEHVSSNIAHGLVKILLERKPDSGKRRKVLICTPYGEEHNLGCNVIESYLSCKGDIACC